MAPVLQIFPSPTCPPRIKRNLAVSPCEKKRIYYILPEYETLKPVEVTIRRRME
jgi:hypothetical protein